MLPAIPAEGDVWVSIRRVGIDTRMGGVAVGGECDPVAGLCRENIRVSAENQRLRNLLLINSINPDYNPAPDSPNRSVMEVRGLPTISDSGGADARSRSQVC